MIWPFSRWHQHCLHSYHAACHFVSLRPCKQAFWSCCFLTCERLIMVTLLGLVLLVTLSVWQLAVRSSVKGNPWLTSPVTTWLLLLSKPA